MLTFKDWVELKLVNSEGEPVPNAEYELHLPDGTTRTGVLNAEAYAREEDLPPGVCIVVFSQPAEPAPSEAG
jgi:type VI secretion system secreted protein VgrG